MSYCTVQDIIDLRGAQSAEATTRLANIIPVIEAQFNIEAMHYGKDLAEMVEENTDLATVTKCLVCDAALNYYNSSASTLEPMSQMSESAGGYSVSGTYLNPGGGLYSKKTWLKLLGVSRQKVGILEPFRIGFEDMTDD